MLCSLGLLSVQCLRVRTILVNVRSQESFEEFSLNLGQMSTLTYSL